MLVRRHGRRDLIGRRSLRPSRRHLDALPFRRRCSQRRGPRSSPRSRCHHPPARSRSRQPEPDVPLGALPDDRRVALNRGRCTTCLTRADAPAEPRARQVPSVTANDAPPRRPDPDHERGHGEPRHYDRGRHGVKHEPREHDGAERGDGHSPPGTPGREVAAPLDRDVLSDGLRRDGPVVAAAVGSTVKPSSKGPSGCGDARRRRTGPDGPAPPRRSGPYAPHLPHAVVRPRPDP